MTRPKMTSKKDPRDVSGRRSPIVKTVAKSSFRLKLTRFVSQPRQKQPQQQQQTTPRTRTTAENNNMECGTTNNDTELSIKIAAATSAVAMAKVQLFLHFKIMKKRKRPQGRIPGSVTIKRRRRDLDQLFLELGPTVFRRMYRMHEFSFWLLCDHLSKSIPDNPERVRGTTPNGDITIPTRIAMALRWAAGGSKYDIGATHGVHPDEVYRSLWLVVDAIHKTKELDITFPSCHIKQQSIADAFRKKSKCGFWNCVGPIDGMLVWTSQPSESTDDMGIGPSKFYNGRKCKFGMNMQGICGPDKKFLDITCKHPGSASDFTMWLDSSLRKKLESPNFLKPGLVLYGDNAYVNTPEMVTPFKSVSKGPKDNYNFYHS